MPDPRLESAVNGAMADLIAYQRKARDIVWVSPSRDQVRAIVESAWSSLAAGSDPEALGRIVRETWVNWAKEQPDAGGHPSWLVPWDELPERDREVDRRIGSAVAAMAVHDADLEALELRKRLVLVGAHLPAILDALTARIADERWESQKARFRDAKAALETLRSGTEDT